MEKENNIPEINLLEDKPTSEDEFGGHIEVAKAIEHFVRTEKGGKSIAITGKYGSGKSTLIKILRDRLQENKSSIKSEVFIYDAWSHQEDPLRRSYLEEFLNFLDEADWINIENWQDTLDRITKRVEDTTTETKPKFTWQTYISALFALVLLPLGLVIASSVTTGIIEGEISPLHYLTLISILLLGFPIIYFIIYGVSFLFKKYYRKEKTKWDPLNIFAYEDHKVLEDKTITTPDPTAIEFRDDFNEICSHIFRNCNDKRLLLVVDNLDRLPSSKALSVWATLLTFLNPSTFDSKKWSENLWVIVPFNIDAISSIWSSSDEKAVSTNTLRKGFVEKTFQVRFDVPPPILSNWHEFFKNKLRRAFPKEDSTEFHKIVKLFESRRVKESHPTPRGIKKFINNLGGLYRQWHSKINLGDLAFYLLVEELLKDDIKLFIKDENEVKPAEKFYLSNSWKESLIAVYFNVPVKRAPEVLIESDLNELFSNGIYKDVEKYQDLKGFYNVVENKIQSLATSNNGQIISNTAIALKGLQKSTHEGYVNSWSYLEKGIAQAVIKSEFSERFADGVITIWEKCNTSNHRKIKFLKSFVSIIEDTDQDLENWFKQFRTIANYLEEEGEEEILSNVKVDLEDEKHLKFISKLQNHGLGRFFPKFTESSKVERVVEVYKNLVRSGNLKSFHNSFPLLLIENDLEVVWHDLFLTYQDKLLVNKNAAADEIEELLSNLILLDIKFNLEEASDALKVITNKPDIYHYLNQYWNSERSAALIVLSILFYNPSANFSGREEQSNNGVQNYNQFKNSIEKNKSLFNYLYNFLIDNDILDEFLRYAEDYHHLNIYREILKSICDSPDAISNIDYKLLIDRFDEINKCLNQEYLNKFVDLITKKNDNWLKSFISSIEFDLKYIDVLKRLMFKKDIKHKSTLLDFLSDGIKSLESNQWQAEFEKDNSSLLDIVTEFNRIGRNLNLQTEFLNSLLTYNKKLKNGQVSNNYTETYWFSLYKSLNDSHQDEYCSKVVKIIVDNNGQVLTLIKLNYQILEGGSYFKSSPEKVADLLMKLAQSNSLEKLEWLKDNLRVFKKYHTELDSEEKDKLKSKLESIQDEDIEQDQRIIISDIVTNLFMEEQ